MQTRINRRALCLMAALLLSPLTHAVEVGGVQVEDKIKLGGSELVLNGAGIRTKVFFKVYVAALYVSQKSASPTALLDPSISRRISLRLLRDVDAETMFDGLRDSLKDNHSEAEMAAMKPQIEKLGEIMRQIGNAKKGDLIDIDFSPDNAAISFNGDARGKVTGPGFNKAMLKIWLGDNPVDAPLKKALLGS